MAAYLIRRLAYGALTVLGVLFLLFVLFFAVTDPDDIARKAVGERARPEVYVQWKKNHGYDRPLFLNREHGASSTAGATPTPCCSSTTGACSPSTSAAATPATSRSPSASGRAPAPASALPCRCSSWGCSLGVSVALFAAFFRETYIDRAVLVACMLTMSIAALLYIIGGQYLVSLLLKWFPISGFDPDAAVVARFLALPVLIGLVTGFGADVRFYRTVFVEEMGRDYVRTARAKGAGDARVMRATCPAQRDDPDPHQHRGRHPVPVHGRAASGVLLRHPGARLAHGRRHQRQRLRHHCRTMVYLGALLFILGQLLTDVSYALADPRVRLS